MRKTKELTLVVVCLAAFVLLLDLTIVNVALVSIQRSIGASFNELQWVVDAYALALAACLLAGGALADRMGPKRVFMGSLVLFTAASMASGLAPSALFLILSRGMQGVGSAVMLASAPALIAGAYTGAERAKAFGAFGGVAGLAIALGPLIGGALTSIDWRWIFFVNVPIGVVCLLLATNGLAESPTRGAARVDWWGSLTLSAGLFLVVFGLIRGHDEGWGSGLIVGSFAVGAALLAAFLALQAVRSVRLLRLSLFRNPTFNGLSVATVLANAAILPIIFLVVIYFQDVGGYTAFKTGLILLPLTVAIFVASLATTKLMGMVPTKVLIGGGLVLTGLGLLLMRALTANSSWSVLVPGFIVAGIGVGLFNPVRAHTAVALVPPEEAGMSSGASSTFQEIGVALGIAGFGSLFEARVADRLGGAAAGGLSGANSGQVLSAAARQAFASAINEVFLVAGLTAIVGGLIALAVIRERDMHGAQPPPVPLEPLQQTKVEPTRLGGLHQ